MRPAPARIVTPAAVVIGLALVAIVASWLALELDTRTTVFTDAGTIREPIETAKVRDVLWEPARPVVAPLDSEFDEYEPRVSLDGSAMFFVRGKPGENADVYVARRTVDGWTDPTPIDAINTDADELGPAPSRDGTALYFYSNRPGGLGGYDLWMTRLGDEGWREPVNLGPSVNSPFNDYGPALAPHGETLYFASNRPTPEEYDPTGDGGWNATLREDLFQRHYDLYEAPITEEGVQTAVPLSALNTDANEGSPAISPYGDFLYFSSDRAGGMGRFDIYRARIVSGEIRPSENLGGAINTPANELDPTLSSGGFELHFSTDRPLERIDPERPNAYNLYTSMSREVFRDVEIRSANVDWPALLTNLLWLLLLLLLLLLLFLLFRKAQRDDRFRRLSLLVKCLLASLLAHALIMLLLAFWMIGTSIGDAWRSAGGTRVIIASSSSSDGLAQQVRGGLTQIEVAPVPASPLAAAPVEAAITPLMQMAALEAAQRSPEAITTVRTAQSELDAPLEQAETSPELAEATVEDTPFRPEAPVEVARSRTQERETESPDVESPQTAPAPVEVARADSRTVETAPDQASLETPTQVAQASTPDADAPLPQTNAAPAIAEARVDPTTLESAPPSEVIASQRQEHSATSPDAATPTNAQAPVQIARADSATVETAVDAPQSESREQLVQAQSQDATAPSPVDAPAIAQRPVETPDTTLEVQSPAESATSRTAESSLRADTRTPTEAQPTPTIAASDTRTAFDVRPADAPDTSPFNVEPLAAAAATDAPAEATLEAATPATNTGDLALASTSLTTQTPQDARTASAVESSVNAPVRVADAAQRPVQSSDAPAPAPATVALNPGSAPMAESITAQATESLASAPADAALSASSLVATTTGATDIQIDDLVVEPAGSLPTDTAEVAQGEASDSPPVRAAAAQASPLSMPDVAQPTNSLASLEPTASQSAPPASSGAPESPQVADASPVVSDAVPTTAPVEIRVDAPALAFNAPIPDDAGSATESEATTTLATRAPTQARPDLRPDALAAPSSTQMQEIDPAAELADAAPAPSSAINPSNPDDALTSTIELSGDPSAFVLDVPPAPAMDLAFNESGEPDAADEQFSDAPAPSSFTATVAAAPTRVDAPVAQVAPNVALEPLAPTTDSPTDRLALPNAVEDAAPTALASMSLTPSATPAEAPSLTPRELSLPSEFAPPNDNFAQRAEENRTELVEQLGGSEETETAVQEALAWLARHQSADGRWDSDGFDDGCGQCEGGTSITSDVALTGLSLLCFMAANHTHVAPGPYQDNVARGLQFLLSQQDTSGDLRSGETMYSHGIASIALAEAFGMTNDQDFRVPAERAIDFIIQARNRERGGWRYAPRQLGDTSVLGWQVMALTSARRAGLEVPNAIFDVASDYLELVDTPSRPGLYAYQPGQPPTVSMTAEAMFVRQLLGAPRNDERMARSTEFILAELPTWGVTGSTYYWYYATLALFQHGGDAWSQWNAALTQHLLANQRDDGNAAGSWDPADRWSQIGGRVYQTAICTLSLEVYYRYLPLYVTSRAEGD